MNIKFCLLAFFGFPIVLAAQYPFSTNEYIQQNLNIITGNDLFSPGDFDSFKGKIKSITQQEYAAERDTAGAVVRRNFIDSHNSYTYMFSKDKKITESWKYSPGQTILTKKYFRDFKNDQVDSVRNWTKNGKPISFEVWQYNEKNFPVLKKLTMMNQTRELNFDLKEEGDKMVLLLGEYRNVYKYLKLVSRTYLTAKKDYTYEYHSSGMLKNKKESEQGHITKNYEYDQNGNLLNFTFYTYDKDGSLLATNEESNTYDKNFRRIESIIVVNSDDSSRIQSHEMYEYEGNNLKYIYRIEKGDKKIFMTYRYNKQGDLIAMESEKTKFTYEYEGYDKQGNWTKAIVRRDGDPFYIWERTIQYY